MGQEDDGSLRAEEFHKVADDFFVFGFFDFSRAGGCALFYAVKDAGSKKPKVWVACVDFETAGAEFKYFLQFRHYGAEVFCTGKGAEQSAAVRPWFSGYVDAG